MTTATSAPTPERVLQRLEWQVVRRLDGLLQGDHRSLFLGAGVDLANLREYQVFDDVRDIDWNVTARTDIPHVRVYHEDREIEAWFLVDLSPSVDFGGADRGRDKRAVTVELVASVARLLSRHGNRVGAMLYSDGDEVAVTIAPRTGRDQVLRVIRVMLDAPRRPAVGATDLRVLLEAAARRIRRRSLVVVVSDLISTPGWERPLSMLARRHEVLVVRVHDPSESALPDVGMLVMADAETGEQVVVDTSDRRFRERFVAAAASREANLAAALRHARVDAQPVGTHEDLVRAIVRMAGRRTPRRGMAR